MIITRAMIMDRIDTEYANLKGPALPYTPRDLLKHRLEALAHLRDAFHNMQIPEELNSTIFKHKKILTEAYLFWVEKAAKGDKIADHANLAAESAGDWLAEIRCEYQADLLRERLSAEHEDFLREERRKTPDEVIHNAGRIAQMDDIMRALTDTDLPPQIVSVLLTIEDPLESICELYLGDRDEESYMYTLIDSALETARLQHLSLTSEFAYPAPQNSVIRKQITKYLDLYGKIEKINWRVAEPEETYRWEDRMVVDEMGPDDEMEL